MTSMTEPLFADPRVDVERRDDGVVILRNPYPMPPAAEHIGDWLDRWAFEVPDRIWVAERNAAGGWREVNYSDARRMVRAIATWLLERGFSIERPIVILSDNSVDQALLSLAGFYCGIPVAAISPAYSLMSADHAKLRQLVGEMHPGMIYVSDADQFAPALAALADLHPGPVVAGRGTDNPEILAFHSLMENTDDAAVDTAAAEVNDDTICRFLFTSGSTGKPKAVINTQRMITANQTAKSVIWPMLEREPPVIVDWLPWSHTFGGNHNFFLVLRNGGTLYVDGGKPAPPLFPQTIANLKSVPSTIHFNVPRGYDMLVEALRDDAELRWQFFSEMKVIFYAAAALPQHLWDSLRELSIKTVGRQIPLVSAWGSTETAPLATDCHFQADRSGNIGLPIPGVELKLVPAGGKMEIRVRGPSVTPGYWKQPELTAAAFDDEGFYKIGDAVRFVDPDNPVKGLLFDGRVSEDFKLTTGTWVSVGALRVAGISALEPVAQDIIVTGHDREEIGFSDRSEYRSVSGDRRR